VKKEKIWINIENENNNVKKIIEENEEESEEIMKW